MDCQSCRNAKLIDESLADRQTILCLQEKGSPHWIRQLVVGDNLARGVDGFEAEMMMYVRDEGEAGEKLCDVINQTRMNQHYMKHCTVPLNVTASSDLAEVTSTADVIIMVLPHQYVVDTCVSMQAHVKHDAKAVSLVKGLLSLEEGHLQLISTTISCHLGVPCAVLMGANIAQEVAMQLFSEATIGCQNGEFGQTLKSLFETPYFRLAVVADAVTVELCGALKNIVALGAGFVDGLCGGRNTNSAVIRLGLMEMLTLVRRLHAGCQMATFFESCGIGDLLTTAVAGRNHAVAVQFARQSLEGGPQSSMQELEEAMLQGQKLQGPATAALVAAFLTRERLQQSFPLFTAIHLICLGDLPVTSFIDRLRNHPEHLKSPSLLPPSPSLSSPLSSSPSSSTPLPPLPSSSK